MFDYNLTEYEILQRYMVFYLIPIYWMLVRFLKKALPLKRGKDK